MTNASPCVGLCRLDDATGYCLGCARTGDEIAEWGSQTDAWRSALWDQFPARFQSLGITCRRLPWETRDIRDFVLRTLHPVSGTWVIGVVGGVAEFTAAPGEETTISSEDATIKAITTGASLQFLIDDHVRALTFDPADTPSEHQRVVLAVKRERGRLPVAKGIANLGPDSASVHPADRDLYLYDLGLGRKEARFCVRCAPGSATEALAAATGTSMAEAMPALAPVLLHESPSRVVESALGRIEVSTPIPAPGGPSPVGPHTHLLPQQLETGRALPVGMDLPAAYLPGAIFYPARGPSGDGASD